MDPTLRGVARELQSAQAKRVEDRARQNREADVDQRHRELLRVQRMAMLAAVFSALAAFAAAVAAVITAVNVGP